MENASLSNEVCVEDDGDFDDYVGKFVVEMINLVIGTIGVLDNLFVVIVFALFIKITDKVTYFYFLTVLSSYFSQVFCIRHATSDFLGVGRGIILGANNHFGAVRHVTSHKLLGQWN